MKQGNLEAKRSQMVEQQILSRGVQDRLVLEAMRKVPRHLFVPSERVDSAYADRPLPIGCGQTISQPYMVAVMTEALALEGHEKVLEIGTGSGYQAAILAEITDHVVSLERQPELADAAAQTLKALGYVNVEIMVGDGSKGYPERAPYDGILVTAGAPDMPHVLIEQLTDGGRLVIPVGNSFQQTLTRVTRRGDDYETEKLEGCVFVPLIGEYGWKESEVE
ncbi:MAG: protein-L-isoaspartate(D-aspartate) O-methyltransferase [Candidatus Eisenbacteria bacterium]